MSSSVSEMFIRCAVMSRKYSVVKPEAANCSLSDVSALLSGESGLYKCMCTFVDKRQVVTCAMASSRQFYWPGTFSDASMISNMFRSVLTIS